MPTTRRSVSSPTAARSGCSSRPPASATRWPWPRAAQYLILLVRHKRAVDEQDALNQALADASAGERHEEASEMPMAGAEALLREGRRLGVDEGRQEAFKALLMPLLERRIGTLTDAQRSKVAALTGDQASLTGVRLLDARSLEELGL